MNSTKSPTAYSIHRFAASLLLVFIFYSTHAADTLHVITHNKLTIVTDPSKGDNLYKAWGVFPGESFPIRQIKLKLRLGCPDSLRCADWDYKDHITIRRKGGVNAPSIDYEIGRMLTPYGGAFARDWNFTWELDITDFSILLRDSVEIEYNHTGYEPNNDRGWSLTLDFEIVRGMPAMQPVSIQKIYDSSYRYGDSSRSIEESLIPVKVRAAKNADFARLRVVQTGHGMDRPDGCGEFCNKYRELWIDGKMVQKKPIWKECGNNPLYPQAGTWIYDRANWCPGDLMQPDIYEFKMKPGTDHTVDINMEPYVSVKPSANEVITAYLVQYRKRVSEQDIAVVDIVSPSSKELFARQNPSGFSPQVIISNQGSATLNNLMIKYGSDSDKMQEFTWKGKLIAGDTTLINLPGLIRGRNPLNSFTVELLQPNGRKDQYPSDNKMTSYYKPVLVHDSTLIVYLLTNRQASQNSYQLINSGGQLLFERKPGSLSNDSLYRDTILLGEGNYRFVFNDSADNGLEFWANPRGGQGKLMLLNKDGAMLKDFESDFGSDLEYHFAVGKEVSPIKNTSTYNVYPTRTNAKTNFDFYSNFAKDVLVQIVSDPGDNLVEEHRYPQLKMGSFEYDLSRFPKGRFYLKVIVDNEEKYKKRIRLKE